MYRDDKISVAATAAVGGFKLGREHIITLGNGSKKNQKKTKKKIKFAGKNKYA